MKTMLSRICATAMVLSAGGAAASPISWSAQEIRYDSIHFVNGYPGTSDSSTTLGHDAVIQIGQHAGIAGDNGERDLKAYADYVYNGDAWYYREEIDSSAYQRWGFSLDFATPIELSYSFTASLSQYGPDAVGGISADLQIYRVRWIGFGSQSETLFAYHYEAAQAQDISEQGSFVFYYDPFEYAPPYDWSYAIILSTGTSAGFSSGTATYQQSAVVSHTASLQAGLTVIPEPATLVLLGMSCSVVFRRTFVQTNGGAR